MRAEGCKGPSAVFTLTDDGRLAATGTVKMSQSIFSSIDYYASYMDLLHFITSSSDFNAIPLRCPFHALAIIQVGFAGAEIFLHLHVQRGRNGISCDNFAADF